VSSRDSLFDEIGVPSVETLYPHVVVGTAPLLVRKSTASHSAGQSEGATQGPGERTAHMAVDRLGMIRPRLLPYIVPVFAAGGPTQGELLTQAGHLATTAGDHWLPQRVCHRELLNPQCAPST